MRDTQELFVMYYRDNPRLRPSPRMRKTHHALKEIYYALSGTPRGNFFRTAVSNESKISLTFLTSPPRRSFVLYAIRDPSEIRLCFFPSTARLNLST